MSQIQFCHAREVLDSRGNPTIEVEIGTQAQSFSRAMVPSGASTGINEACELRDGDKSRFQGKGVLKAVRNVIDVIKPKILGLEVCDQTYIDSLLVELDGSENKSNLGANALLGVSMACAKAAASDTKLPLYRYLGGASACRLPVPMMNILNGGAHADNNVDFQEFMVVPHGFDTFSSALHAGVRIFHQLKSKLHSKGLATSVGDEGGMAPNLKSNAEAIDLIMESIEEAGYKPADQISIALDVAASSFYKDNAYRLEGEGKDLDSNDMVSYLTELSKKYPIISIEDGLDENDWQGFSTLTNKIGSKVQIVGDDLFVTNQKFLQRGISERAANSILIKLNQIGTVSETLQTIELAHKSNFSCVVSHRSGETEDTFIADLAVATNCGQIKTGSLCRSERTAKYNQLLRIEEELCGVATYGL